MSSRSTSRPLGHSRSNGRLARRHRVAWHKPASTPHPSAPLQPPNWVGPLALGLGFAGLIFVVLLAVSQINFAALHSVDAIANALGRVCGLLGTYAMFIMVVLIARIPALERIIGQDRLVRWHRTIGGWPIGLIAVHIASVTIGYAHLTNVSVFSQFITFVLHYPDILAALVGFLLLVMAGVSSHHSARRKMRYETWWSVHLYLYLGLGFAVAHQVTTGAMFIHNSLLSALWVGSWMCLGLVALACRLGLPLIGTLRHQLRVAEIELVAPGVTAVTLVGKRLDELAISGGQFFQWRFLQRGLWSHSHPYSVSAMPRPPYLRVTVKGLGDQSTAVRALTVGTRVFIEGPYGTFTRQAARTNSMVLFGAGVGVTPLRALLEDLPTTASVTVVVRGSNVADLVHREELVSLCAARGAAYHEVIGPRSQNVLDARWLKSIAPNAARSDFYLCGPKGFTESIEQSARRLKVPRSQIHVESFEL